MKLIKNISLVVILFSLPTFVFAQKVWTLEECIDYAVKNNIQLKRTELGARVADYDLLKSKADLTPTFFASARHGMNKGLDFNYYTSTYEDREVQSGFFGVQGTLDLFRGFSRVNNISRNKLNLLASLQDVEHQKNALTLNVVAAYLQVLYSNEMQDLSKEQLDLAELRHEKAKLQLNLGQLSQSEYLEVNAQLANQRRATVAADNDAKLALLTIAQLLEIEEVESFRIDIAKDIDPSQVSVPKGMGQILDIAYSTLPQLKASEFRYQVSRKDFRMAQALRSPSIYLSYDYTSRYSQSARDPFSLSLRPYPEYTYREQITDNTFGRIFLVVDIPILNRFTAQNQISKAKIRVSDAELEVEQVRKDILKIVQQSYTDALGANENYALALSSVENYQEVYNMTARRFELGQASAVDVGISRANLTSAQVELLNAKYTFVLRVKILDFYRGLPITL